MQFLELNHSNILKSDSDLDIVGAGEAHFRSKVSVPRGSKSLLILTGTATTEYYHPSLSTLTGLVHERCPLPKLSLGTLRHISVELIPHHITYARGWRKSFAYQSVPLNVKVTPVQIIKCRCSFFISLGFLYYC